MARVEDHTHVTIPAETPVTPPATAPPPAATSGESSGFTIRWRKEDILRNGCLTLRGMSFIFSLISLIVMASNKHGGDGRDFDEYQEFKYVLVIACLSTLHTRLQCLKHVYELSTRTSIISRTTLALIGFFGNQILAYLLI